VGILVLLQKNVVHHIHRIFGVHLASFPVSALFYKVKDNWSKHPTIYCGLMLGSENAWIFALFTVTLSQLVK
jgi:hypothetical protein